MKRIVTFAVTAAACMLAACSQTAPEPAATDAAATQAAAATPAATAPATLAADGKSSVGKFKVTTSDGKVMMEDVKADGTYVQTDETGKVVETGKWEQKAPETYCYTPDKEGATQECNTEGVDAAGKWTSKDPEGNVATVERVEG